MEIKHRKFLEENIGNWHTAQAGFIRNLELNILQEYEQIYRAYIDPNFILTVWCGSCKMEIITKIYKYYEKLPPITAIPIASFTITETGEVTNLVEEKPAKKRGRPKK